MYCVYQSWVVLSWLFLVFFWLGGVFLGLEPKLLNKESPVALRCREHPLHPAAGTEIVLGPARSPQAGGMRWCRRVDV